MGHINDDIILLLRPESLRVLQIRRLQISHNINFVSNFSWVLQWYQEKLITLLRQFFFFGGGGGWGWGAPNKVDYGGRCVSGEFWDNQIYTKRILVVVVK